MVFEEVCLKHLGLILLEIKGWSGYEKVQLVLSTESVDIVKIRTAFLWKIVKSQINEH